VRTLQRAMLVALGLLLGLGLAELGLRAVDPPAGADLLIATTGAGGEPGMYRPHPVLGFEPTPGFTGRVGPPGHRVALRFDSHGLRGPEPGPQRPRWLVVGDSFTLAAQVPEEQSFPHLLGLALGQPVLNGGIEAIGTPQAAARYRIVDDALGVEAVLLLFFTGNDLVDNQQDPRALAHGHGQPPPEGERATPRMSLLARLAAYSRLVGHARLLQRQRDLRDPQGFEHQRLREQLLYFSGEGTEPLQRALGPTRHQLEELRDEADRRGDRLVVGVAPPLIAVDRARAEATLALVGLQQPAVDAPQRAVLALLEQLGVQACDLTPALREAQQRGEQLYLLLDGHWSTRGHAVAAQALEACLGVGTGGSGDQPGGDPS
jgi:hypothetical protein